MSKSGSKRGVMGFKIALKSGHIINTICRYNTAGFTNTVPSVYTLIINTLYLSHSTQVAEETVFRKHMVPTIGDLTNT